MEAPENRYLTWVCGHGLEERPYKQNKQYVENRKHYHDPYAIDRPRTPNDKDIGIINQRND